MAAAKEPASATIVAVATDPAEARIWLDALRDAGVEAAVLERGAGGALGGASLLGDSWAVLVSRARIEEARGVIAELGGAHALVDSPTAEEERAASHRAFRTVAGAVLLVALAFAVLRFVFG